MMTDAPAQGFSDVELVRKVADGNQNALTELIFRYAPLVGAIIVRFAGAAATPADVEEAVADCFLTTWHLSSSYEAARSPVIAWLTHIARYRGLGLRRSLARRRREQQLQTEADELLDQSDSVIDTVVDKLSLEERFGKLHEALQSLSPRDIDLIYERFSRGLSPQEIAANTGVSANVIRVRLSRAIARLRSRLVAAGPVPVTCD